MKNKLRWQVPGNGNPFDSPLEEWKDNKMSQRSIGVLKFILEENNNSITKQEFEKNIKDYLKNKFNHVENNSTTAHFYRPLEFIGLIRNHDNKLSISIDGRSFINKIESGDFRSAKEFYLLQMLKAKYPNTATKHTSLNLFPFRIIFKTLLEKEIAIEDFCYKIPYITSLNDIENYNNILGEYYEKWKVWCISYLIKWKIIVEEDTHLSLSKEAKDFLYPILKNMNYEDMFFNEENEIYLTNKIYTHIKRDKNLVSEVLIEEDFTCFINSSHITFPSVNRKNYVEGHHIIPLSLQNSFQTDLDCKDNIIPLCPNCHKAIHLATTDIKIEYIKAIFSKNQKLKTFNLDTDDLLEIYLIKVFAY
ncbi:MAG: HNH endonuclease [Alphaproteobacteria bacterium]|jgi:5-methylcytosine-specific restriction protein A|nr:HNH endonuclease [Alphaproteobacteria bacterium]